MKEKYGFVYIWRDRKRNRYYVGRHWGTEDDEYICSSNWMRDVYNRRPQDFKRRILTAFIKTRSELVIKEQYWLNFIKVNELGNRYYNKNKKATSPTMYGRRHSEETKRKIGNSTSKALKLKASNMTAEERSLLWGHSRGTVHTEETKRKMSQSRRGKKLPPRTEQEKQNLSLKYKGKTYEERFGIEEAIRLKNIRRNARLNKPSYAKGKTWKWTKRMETQ